MVVANMKESNVKNPQSIIEDFFIIIFVKNYLMKKWLLFIFLFYFSSIYSQEFNQDQRVWFAYTGFFKVSTNWSYQVETQFRMDNELQQSQQNLFRVGALYNVSSSKHLAAGYALVNTYSNSIEDYFKENRLWEQFQYNKKWYNDKNTMLHRFRLEQRWVEQITLVDNDVKNSTTNYQNRLRYLNRNLIHLHNFNFTQEELYLVIQDEVFFTVGNNNINTNFIDQNRFFIGLGLNFKNTTRFEMGYLNHFITSSISTDVMNHTISVAIFQNLSLQKQ
jgi:cob(I)alamin adenosyltransferase